MHVMRFFAETFIFIVRTPNTYKTMPRLQYSTRVITFHPPQNAPNGAFTRPETTAGARWDCDARNCFDARTTSDARGSNDARTEWIANLSTISPPRSYLAPVLAKGQPKFRLLGGRELWSGPSQNALLHSLLGAMLNWKLISDNLFDTCLCDRWTQMNSTGW